MFRKASFGYQRFLCENRSVKQPAENRRAETIDAVIISEILAVEMILNDFSYALKTPKKPFLFTPSEPL